MKITIFHTYIIIFCVLILLPAKGFSWFGSEEEDKTKDHDHDHTHGDDEDPDIIQEVTCGSVIKLKHVATNHRLHSHQVSYGSGSGQQSVTGMNTADDANSFWVIRGGHNKKRCKQGEPIKNGEIIRLQHLNTKLNLHSHQHPSPLSRFQEVSCYGPDGNGDASDNWRVVLATDIWLRKGNVEFEHVETGQWLHSHTVTYKHPIPGQQEVSCVPDRGVNTRWMAEEGIFFPSPAKGRSLATEGSEDTHHSDSDSDSD